MTDQQISATETEKPAIKPNKKWAKRILCSISAVVFLCVLIIVGLISVLRSDSATQKLITFIDDRLDSLHLTNFQGNLQQGLTIKDLKIQSENIHGKIDFAFLKLDFNCLWRAEICLDEVHVNQTALHINTAKSSDSTESKEKSAGKLTKLFFPLSVNVKQVLLENIALDIDHHALRLARFNTSLTLNNQSGLTLQPTDIRDFSWVSTITDKQVNQQKTTQKTEQVVSSPINWSSIENTLAQPLLANVKSIELPFDFHIHNLLGENLSYQQFLITQTTSEQDKSAQTETIKQWDIQIDKFQLQADSADFITQIKQLDIQSNLGKLQAQGKIQLNQDFPLDLSLQASLNDILYSNQILWGKTDSSLSLSGNLKKQTALLWQSQGAIEANLSLQAEFNKEKTPFTLSLQSDRFSYPFIKNDPLHTKEVKLAIHGNLLDYHIDLAGEVSGMAIPKSQLNLIGQGGIKYIEIEKLQLNALQGESHLQGKLDWTDGITWSAEAKLHQMNLGAYLKQWPAILSGELSSKGKVNNQNWLVQLPKLDIQGQLSQRNLAIKGNLSVGNQQWFHSDQLLFNYGENRIEAKGKLGKQSDFELIINSPNLTGLLPTLNGSIIGNAAIKGEHDNLAVNLDLSTQHLVYQDYQINQGNIRTQLSSTEQIHGEVNANINGLKYGEIFLNNITLLANGNEQAHQLNLRSQGRPIAIDMNLSGNFDRTLQRWQGQLRDNLIKTEVGNVTTDKSFDITYHHTNTQTEITPHCWKHNYAELCFTNPLNIGTNGNIDFVLKRLDFALFNQLMEQSDLFKGQINSQGNLQWSENESLNININLEGQKLSLSPKINHRLFNLNVDKLSINSQLMNNNLNLTSQIQLLQQGVIKGELGIQDIAQQRKLSGGLQIQKVTLDLLNQLLSKNEKVEGEINSSLTFGGDLNKPLLNGQLKVGKIATRINVLPFHIEQSELEFNFHGDRSTLSGYLESPHNGKLILSGETNWQNFAQWQSRLQAEAKEFLVELPALGQVKISPNITVKANAKNLELSGEVKIPWARLEIDEFPESAVSVSDDEVILTAKTTKKTTALPTRVAAKTQSGMLINSDMKIAIGDDVKINAYGLKSDLQGLLSVRQERGNLGLFGQIFLKNGRYNAYGQDLFIRKGEINFSGLAGQPMLNIEAVRNPDAMENSSIVAGLKVTGVATNPEVNVFSVPALPQDQALSYLLTGRSLENSGETGSSGSIGAALLGLGLSKSGKIVGGIGQAFGIQDLSVDTAGVGENSKVEISGNITPRLKVKYGVGLFDGLAEVTVRYRLLPQLYLQSVSGVNQAFDLLYQFEF